MTIRIGINQEARRRQMSARINAERDRRIVAGFPFAGHRFDFDPASKSRITGAATLAGFALAQGAVPGDLQWNGVGVDFTWLSADNVAVPMDAATCFAFGAAAAEHERAHIFAARALKDAETVPDDFAADAWWPGAGE